MEKMTGIVSDIQRFCLHDGPGIRTTVFLKGCPLRCAWCANPETQVSEPQLMRRIKGCTRCTACVDACPAGALFLGREYIIVDHEKCRLCGTCVTTCPNQLFEIKGECISAGAVMKTVKRDHVFYEASGGGMTISGGEPLSQPDFTLALLRLSKEASISTCIETSLYAPFEAMERLLPFLDTILFDFKHSDSQKHKRYTGGTVDLVLDNIEKLLKLRPDAQLRIPLIPGFNDSATEIDIICRSLQSLGVEQVELMKYHNLAVDKYAALDRDYPYASIQPMSEQAVEAVVERYLSLGFRVRGDVERGESGKSAE